MYALNLIGVLILFTEEKKNFAGPLKDFAKFSIGSIPKGGWEMAVKGLVFEPFWSLKGYEF